MRTFAPLTEDEFGGEVYDGVPLVSFEDGETVAAWGHVDPDRFVAAALKMSGLTTEDVWEWHAEPGWVVTTRPADHEDGWLIQWGSVTSSTNDAWPVTFLAVGQAVGAGQCSLFDSQPTGSGDEAGYFPDCPERNHLAVDCPGDGIEDHDPTRPQPTDSEGGR